MGERIVYEATSLQPDANHIRLRSWIMDLVRGIRNPGCSGIIRQVETRLRDLSIDPGCNRPILRSEQA